MKRAREAKPSQANKNEQSRARQGPAPEVTAMAAYPLLLEAALVFFSARFSLRDLDAAVLALFFFGDLSAIGHPSLGSTDGFGGSRLPLADSGCTANSLRIAPQCCTLLTVRPL
jgi:hypothetical protein